MLIVSSAWFGIACQVILISSSNDPVSEVLSEKLSQHAGCVLRYRVENKQSEVESLMKERGLQWRDVAYFGESPNNLVSVKQISFTVLNTVAVLCPRYGSAGCGVSI